MGQSKGHKIKTLGNNRDESDSVFWLSLDEAKRAISDKYEFLAERYEKPQRKLLLKHKI